MIDHVLRAVSGVKDLSRLLVVVGHGAELVEQAVKRSAPSAELVRQPELLGTADAVRRCESSLREFSGRVLVLPGDSPLITTQTLERLARTGSDVALVTARYEDPAGYGRILRDAKGMVEGIVEEADADESETQINEVSTGFWCFHAPAIFDAIAETGNDNAQGEYYLPDAAMVLARKTGDIYTLMIQDAAETLGVNDRWQLAEAARELRLRKLRQLAEAGVTIIDPSATYVDDTVEVGPETVLMPNTYLEGKTTVGERCVIGPSVRIVDSLVEDGAEVTFAVVRESRIGPQATVGPFASLRPGTVLESGSKVGTFVEVKSTKIGKGSKVPHLSYMGDADVGDDVNVGAGTITCNYDGETRTKSKTKIEDGVLIGSDTMLVAPVTMGRDSVTGAGSVVTKDVGPEDVVVGVPATVRRKRKPRARE